MATLDEYKAYSPTWQGIGTQIAISSSISLACLGVHELFRNRSDFRHLFSARCYLTKNASPPPSKTFLGWIKAIWNIEESFILHNVGLDAVLYLRALKLISQVMLFLVIIAMPIILPLNYLGSETSIANKDSVEAFSITGIGLIKEKLWVHSILSCIVTLFILYLIYRNTVDFVQLRRIHFIKETTDGNPRCRTVMVTNIPSILCNEDRLKQHFNSLGLGEVHCVQLLKYPTKLIDYLNRRKKALVGLENAHIELAKNLLNAVKENNLREEEFIKYNQKWEYQQIKQYLKDPKRYSNNLIVFNNNELRDKLILQSSIESETISIWDILLKLNFKILEPFHPHHRTNYKTGKLCQSIDYFYNKIMIFDRRIKLLKDEILNSKHDEPNLNCEITSTGFVTFANAASAQLCAQSIIHPSINTCQTYLAPEPKDILWQNHTKSRHSKLMRKIIVNMITWAMIITWLIPVVTLLSLVSFDSLVKAFPDLEKLSKNAPWATSLIQTLIPSILLAVFMSILPHLLYLVSSIEAWKTFSTFERSVTVRYYYFCVFNVVFLFLLGPSFLTIFIDALENKVDIVKTFADRIPRGAAFFINYVIFNICYQFMELIFLASPFILSLLSWLYPKSPRERKVLEHSWNFPFFYYIPNHLLIFVIVLTYAIVNPFIIPVGFLFFFCVYFIFKHQFVYCYIKRYESNGKIWNLFVRFLTDGIVISQLTVACIIAFNRQYYAVIPIVFTLIATFYFKYYYRKTFRPRLKFVPLDSLKEADASSHTSNHKTTVPNSPRQSIEIMPIQPNSTDESIKFKSPVPLAIATVPIGRKSKAIERISIPETFNFVVHDPYGRISNPLQSPIQALDVSLAAISEANGEDAIEEQPDWHFYAQAFTHPALTKVIPTELCVSKYPNHLNYDLYKDVIRLDLIFPTSESQPPRRLLPPEAILDESNDDGSVILAECGLSSCAQMASSQTSLNPSDVNVPTSFDSPYLASKSSSFFSSIRSYKIPKFKS